MAQAQITVLNPNGINKDMSPYESPKDKWSDGNNIEFDNNKTAKVLGNRQVFGTPTEHLIGCCLLTLQLLITGFTLA